MMKNFNTINILIVDDKEDNLYVLENILKELQLKNISIIKALSGRECLEIALKNEVELIILDIQMPDMNGFEVAKFLKSNAKTKHIPIIFLTSVFKKETFIKKGLELGTLDYFTKPIEKYSFLAKLKVYIELFQKQKELLGLNENLDTIVEDKTAALVIANKELEAHQIEIQMQNVELLRNESELNESKKRYFDLYNLAPIGYCTLNEKGLIEEANLRVAHLLGSDQKKLIKKPFSYFVHKDYQDIYYRFTQKLLESHTNTECELQLLQHNKKAFWAQLSASYKTNNNKVELRLLLDDISDAKIAEEKLLTMAYYDGLTDLPNRVLLADRLQQKMIHVQREKQILALIFLDLDAFKEVNDTHGHEVGDKLLIALAKKMQSVLREEDTLARIGGDEFVVVLSDLSDIQSSLPLIKRLRHAVEERVLINDLEIQVSASLGITFFPQGENIDPDHLLRQADQAMYQAKISGKNRYHIFDTEKDDFIRERFEDLQRLDEALENDEFILYYQPKVNMRTGKVIGVEALIRWDNPQKGLMLPNDFLPLMEGHDLSIALGEWVMRSALRQIQLWQNMGIAMPISINITALQLLSNNFLEEFQKILLEFPDVKPSFLEVEVLETSKIEDLSQASKVINSCKKFGVHFSLDDFGTGYSSLTYLKRLAITYIKIDQSFVRDMLQDPSNLAILEGIIKLSESFGVQVIAEGVETLEHGNTLLGLGCEFAQGYFISPPMPCESFPDWLRAWKPDASWTEQSRMNDNQSKVLFAGVEHRAWIASIDAFLKGEIEIDAIGNIEECYFGRWIDIHGESYFGSHESFMRVKDLHERIHKLAAELLELHKNAQKKEILKVTKELHSLNDAFLQKIALEI